jgi:protein-tyrosine phosphatase
MSLFPRFRKRSIRWKEFKFPITDYGIPDDLVAFKSFIETIVSRLSEGQTMLLHCAAGIGRTGTVACAILIRLGVHLEDAVRIVGEAGSFAEDTSQVTFLKDFAKDH